MRLLSGVTQYGYDAYMAPMRLGYGTSDEDWRQAVSDIENEAKQPLRDALSRIIDEEWAEYVDHLVVGTTPSLLLDYIRRDLRRALVETE